jgi:hypothetical protein
LLFFQFLFSLLWVRESSCPGHFLSYIFTSPFVWIVFRFHVSKAHLIFRYICHERCVFVVEFKKHRCLFSDRRYKRTLTANRNTLFSLRRKIQWHDCLRFSLSMVYRNWTKVFHCHHFSSFILYANFLWNDSLHFSRLSVHPNGSSKAKDIKAASIRKDHITVKVKLNTLYPNVKNMYKSI